jgi:hypothetical protein
MKWVQPEWSEPVASGVRAERRWLSMLLPFTGTWAVLYLVGNWLVVAIDRLASGRCWRSSSG